jgi:hypothetical protein
MEEKKWTKETLCLWWVLMTAFTNVYFAGGLCKETGIYPMYYVQYGMQPSYKVKTKILVLLKYWG